jgi:hypothetical protein
MAPGVDKCAIQSSTPRLHGRHSTMAKMRVPVASAGIFLLAAILVVQLVLVHLRGGGSAVPEVSEARRLGRPKRDKSHSSAKYWYAEIAHNGEASFMNETYKRGYPVFRDVVSDFGADDTGANDASVAFQTALNSELTRGCL